MISKKVQEITQIYDNFFEEVRQARLNAESKIVQFRDLIDYCDKKRHQNSTIDLNQQWDILKDFQRLVRFYDKTQIFKVRIEVLKEHYNVIELLRIIPNLNEYR